MDKSLKINVHDIAKVSDQDRPKIESTVQAKDASASLEALKGTYSNITTLSFMPNEFVFDFLFQIGQQPLLLNSRVITSPAHAKAISKVLKDQIDKYENTYGEIVPIKDTKPEDFLKTKKKIKLKKKITK